MKAILMSIQSKWLCKILNGEKTVELRKRFPKDYRGWVYLYCTKGKQNLYIPYISKEPILYVDYLCNGKVVGRVWVDNVEKITYEQLLITTANSGQVFNDYLTYTPREKALLQKSCLESEELYNYLWRTKSGKAIYFSKPEIFDKPKELSEFSVERYAEMPNGVFPCYEPIIKAPQSWQYVEVEDDNSNETLRKEKQL